MNYQELTVDEAIKERLEVFLEHASITLSEEATVHLCNYLKRRAAAMLVASLTSAEVPELVGNAGREDQLPLRFEDPGSDEEG